MRKTLSWILCVLLALALLPGLAAPAEAPACPVNAPPAAGLVPIRWQLYSGEAPACQISLAVDAETALRTYTLLNPTDWGIDPAALGTWVYNSQAAAEDEQSGAWVQTRATGEQVVLQLSDADYAELGFPTFEAPCTAGADRLRLNVFLGQVRKLYAYVDYNFGDDSISITAEDNSFYLSYSGQTEAGPVSVYSSYDPQGILAYASCMLELADGGYVAYQVSANPGSKSYPVTNLSCMNAEGEGFYLEGDQWINDEFEPVDVPEGLVPQQLPFVLEGEWAGIPFAQPGDAAQGTFPTGDYATDAALQPLAFKPWAAEETVIYRSWQDASPAPVLPVASWETAEDGSLLYRFTGVEAWGLKPEDQCTWVWSPALSDWQRDGEPTPGTLTLAAPADMTAPDWRQPCADPAYTLYLSLSRDDMRQLVQLEGAEGWWQLDNRGSLWYSRPLSGNRTLHAEYIEGQLVEYSIDTVDEEGCPVSYTAFDAPKNAPDTFTLHLYYHYSEDAAREALWLRDIGWYSYETGEECEGPAGVEPTLVVPLELR